jgi:D-3-phosphoglycerate dehydrogenase
MVDSYRILTLNKISAAGLKRLPAASYQVAADIPAPDAILVRSQLMHDMVIPASVKAIARAGVGVNNVPVAAMSARGVPVFNASGANANAVKELVVAGMLLAARNIVPALHFVATLQGDDEAVRKSVEEGKKQFDGIELRGRTLGIIGLGAIGRQVADIALSLGMHVYGYDPEITVEGAWSLSAQVKKAQSIEELLRHSDFVTLHVPLLDATRGMIDARRVAAMKQNAVLLNFSRDGIVDNEAVLSGLQTKRLRGYVCDFPAQKLQGQAGVVTLPHLGASTEEAEENCAVMVVQQVREYLEHGNIANSVNFPTIYMPRESAYRIAVANANVPNMLGQISTALAKAGINIHNMMNKSRGDTAYTLVDTDTSVPPELIAQISAIPGVLMVRNLTLLET